MAIKRTTRKKTEPLNPEDREQIVAAAFEHPNLGVRRLARVLKDKGVVASESAIRTELKKEGIPNCEVRLRKLEDRHLTEGLALSESQRQALEKYNPCLRERCTAALRRGRLLVMDTIDLGELLEAGRVFLHVAIDSFCCLAFARLARTPDSTEAALLLSEQAVPFYRRHAFAPPAASRGPGIWPGQEGDAGWEKLLKALGMTVCPELEDAASRKNGFVERFEHLVRAELIAQALREGGLLSLSELQKEFASWIERYNTVTQLPGYPTMGRPPMEVFEQETLPAIPDAEPEPRRTAVSAPPAAEPSSLEPPPPRPVKWAERMPSMERWLFRGANAGLTCLLIYYGWAIASQLLDHRWQVNDNTGLTETVQLKSSVNPSTSQVAEPPLKDYHVVWDRNLFGIANVRDDAAKRESLAVERIAVAEKNIGLRLIGTAVFKDRRLNYAVIEVIKSRTQDLFRENERIGNTLIKQILRNNVIIVTAMGVRRLNIDDNGIGIEPSTPLAAAGMPASAQPAVGRTQEGTNNISIAHEVAGKRFSDFDHFIAEVNILPPHPKIEGLRLGAISANNLLAQIGLRSGDVIKQLNGENITGPADAETFFQILTEVGKHTIVVERRGRQQTLNLSVN